MYVCCGWCIYGVVGVFMVYAWVEKLGGCMVNQQGLASTCSRDANQTRSHSNNSHYLQGWAAFISTRWWLWWWWWWWWWCWWCVFMCISMSIMCGCCCVSASPEGTARCTRSTPGPSASCTRTSASRETTTPPRPSTGEDSLLSQHTLVPRHRPPWSPGADHPGPQAPTTLVPRRRPPWPGADHPGPQALTTLVSSQALTTLILLPGADHPGRQALTTLVPRHWPPWSPFLLQ